VSNVKKRGPSEGSGTTPTVKFNGEARLKFHEATKAGMTGFLPRHDPSGSIRVTIELMLGGLFRKKESQKKRLSAAGTNGKKNLGSQAGANRPTQWQVNKTREHSPQWINQLEVKTVCQKLTTISAWIPPCFDIMGALCHLTGESNDKRMFSPANFRHANWALHSPPCIQN